MDTQKFTTKEFKEKLEATHDFPTLYMFKFIVLEEKKEEVKALFPLNDVVYKPSSKGKYMSVTAKVMAPSSDFVIGIYQKAHQIQGIIAL
ncbi:MULTISPECIES: DUF493 family protein [Roseivirga]|jgi:hypothetical protein|uniref:DUF493 domain-containing protein n=1 Tax=Roseivirga thermotolerans TaxID=1758176 RepID=A0ABQ3I5E1_9BACT|nr:MULTISPECIES: DUF493 family protein [Roseivirga]MEC7755139.1 DUF493 family protein [Bacteroidota bacterium]GHE56004.1 hypothetical protein GCM10011340_08540 [Roseivirga thermotolerans]|tara:strand:- start:390 stop:659 length:270 start_codon:yes stop_codon:yes gene_type:complete